MKNPLIALLIGTGLSFVSVTGGAVNFSSIEAVVVRFKPGVKVPQSTLSSASRRCCVAVLLNW